MSSSKSDAAIETTTLHFLGQIQRNELITRQRFQSIRQFVFQSIGFSILLYSILQIPTLVYLLLKFIVRIVSIIFWIPLKTTELFLPKTNNYAVLFPLFWLFSIVSFVIVKFSRKSIDLHLGKRYKLTKTYAFTFVFIALLLLQTIFILLPISMSIQERRRVSSNPFVSKQPLIKLSEKEVEQAKTLMNKDGNSQRVESTLMSNRENSNERNKNKVSSNEEQELVFPQQANNLVDSDLQFSSKVLEESSRSINKPRADVIKQNKPRVQSTLKEQQRFLLHQQCNRWLDEAWNIYRQNKRDFHQLYSLSMRYTHYLPQYSVTSIYTAYTDLNCYEYTKPIDRYPSTKQKYIDILDTYRRRSPFPIYLSILKSNGPKCYRHYPNSSCAINSKDSFTGLKRQLYYFTQLWVIAGISIVIFRILLTYRRHDNKSNTNQQILSTVTNDLSLPQITAYTKRMYPLNEKLEKELRSWLERERRDGYRTIREIYRTALNDLVFKKHEQLQIETLQFTDANIHSISQTSVEPPVINATLSIAALVFGIINPINDHHYSIEIRQLTGELQVYLIDNIEVKFQQIQIDSITVIDINNVLSSEEKQSLIHLLTEILNQTMVQFCMYQSTREENIINTMETPPPTLSPISQQCETPLIKPTTDTHPQILPQKQTNKLLVRIVKAVKLHDVEQPFCILELNHPKQVHRTSVAKNGVNPFWDERFLFECNEKSHAIHLKIIDRKKPSKKLNPVEILYADVSIPFSYVTSTSYKQDVRITPQFPESIIRIEFSTISEEEATVANNGFDVESITDIQSWPTIRREANRIQCNHQQSPSEEFSILPYETDQSPRIHNGGDNVGNNTSKLPRTTTTTDIYPTPPDDDMQLNKPFKSRSFIHSLRQFSFVRRKKRLEKGKQTENGVLSTPNSATQTNIMSHSLSAEPFLYSNTTDPTSFHRQHSASRSFRNLFRSSSKKKTPNTCNFIIDHPDLLTPSPKKRSFFQRFKSKPKRRQIASSANSLTSYDCTRAESVQNTPVRANGGRPVTMIKSPVQG